MHGFLHLLLDALRNSILVTGLVIIMMLMIEFVNIHSQGRLFGRLRKNRFGQVVLGAGLGLIPGCMGGFAAVSMYSHKMLSFGALIAAMIASSGDEAFIMLAMIPKEALILGAALFCIAILAGWLVDRFAKPHVGQHLGCDEEYQIHHEDHHDGVSHEKSTWRNMKHASGERIALILGVLLFIIALSFGMLEHEHGSEAHETHQHETEMGLCETNQHDTMALEEAPEEAEVHHAHLNIFDEYWLNLIFAIISLFVVYFIATAPEHIIKEHLWEHVIGKHFLPIFLWTFGALIVIELGLQYLHIEDWVSGNIPWMILLAVLIGIIPESGPHLIFVTLFAAGLVPFSVLLASSISQDGHASLPLLAESKDSFLKAKLINVVVAAIFGYACYFIGF